MAWTRSLAVWVLLGGLLGCSDGSSSSDEVRAGAAGASGQAGAAGEGEAGEAGEAGMSGGSGQSGQGGTAGAGSEGGEGGEGGEAGASGKAGASGEAGASGAGQGGGASGAGGGAGASGAAGEGGAAGSGGGTDGVMCGAALPGPALEPGLVEDSPTYETKVASLDIASLPATISVASEGEIQRATLAYMLGTSGPLTSFATADATGPLGEAVLYALAASKGKKLDFSLLRQGLHSRYACATGFPATLAGLKLVHGDYTTWESQTLDSAPKCTERRVFRNPEGTLSVAETLEGGVVRETEVLRAGRADGSLDFAVYTADGHLTNRSSFATVGGDELIASAPYTCMSCHLDFSTKKYDVVFPDGTGACAE